ncbi:MAG: HAMP domain-containing histidine kinase [Clostridium sartagoforme]|nr:HAMP domain-containing histidine kinase [Clostridium sartagoforme]
MDYNNFREKIYYMNLRDIILYIFFTLVIYILFVIFSVFNKNFASDLLKITELIISIILLIFAIHIKSITKKEIYGLIQVFLLINFIVILVFLSPDGQFTKFKELLRDIGYNRNSDFRYINTVIFYYMISKYRLSESNSKNVYLEYVILLVINVIQTYLYSKYGYWQIKVTHLFFLSYILILTFRNICIFDFDAKGKIDLIKLNFLFEAIRFVFLIISKILPISVISMASIVLMQIILLATMIAIIINITKENYNFLFRETIMTSKYLEGINRKIIKKNYILEDTYRKLSEKQMLYKSFLGSLVNPIVMINNNFRISYCNSKFLNEIGKKNIREVVNRRIDKYINFGAEINKEALFNNKVRPNTTTIDLNNKKIEIRFFYLNSDDSECILIFKDLTAEMRLSNMKEELEEIRIREEVKRNFLSNISHDLKIPVNVIYSAIQLEKILIDKNDVTRLKTYNEISKENCIILTKFTNNLIDISKIDSENLEINLSLDNIVGFIEDYLFSLSPYINKSGLNITFDPSEEDIYIYFDKEMIQRVILNLVSNSTKFTKKGGNIFVKIDEFKDYVLIEFKDDGIGMSKEFVSKAFNKYEMENRYKNSSGAGFGVGLYVVYNLIKAQNGDVEIESEKGKGTKFIIKLYKKRVL